jgi:hypothetical protein
VHHCQRIAGDADGPVKQAGQRHRRSA